MKAQPAALTTHWPRARWRYHTHDSTTPRWRARLHKNIVLHVEECGTVDGLFYYAAYLEGWPIVSGTTRSIAASAHILRQRLDMLCIALFKGGCDAV